MKGKIKSVISVVIIAVAAVCAILCEYVWRTRWISLPDGDLFYGIAVRALGSVVCLVFMFNFSSRRLLSARTRGAAILAILPCMLIAINNFPFVSVISRDAYIGGSLSQISIYGLMCICVGLFEELAFRGCIFYSIIERRNGTKADVFWSVVLSSAVFGVIHIINLFMGSDPGAVLLQIGYSFLIGALCSIILIKTQNIWWCVLFHSVYNFAGGVVPRFGGGIIWSHGEIILTVAVSVTVAIYTVVLFMKISPQEILHLYESETVEDKEK